MIVSLKFLSNNYKRQRVLHEIFDTSNRYMMYCRNKYC